MRTHKSHGFSVLEVLIVLVVVAIVGVLGYAYWTNVDNSDSSSGAASGARVEPTASDVKSIEYEDDFDETEKLLDETTVEDEESAEAQAQAGF